MSTTNACDNCGAALPGFGVLYGAVASHLLDGEVEEILLCYANGCRDQALGNLIRYTTGPTDPVRCSLHGLVMESRSIETAMLITDLPTGADEPRYLVLCYANGGRDALLANIGRTP